jgi:2-haloacid dehalogenase
VERFLNEICTMDWNEKQDGGRSIAEANRILIEKYPLYRPEIEAYYGRWEEMLGGPIDATVDILEEIKASRKYRLYALTNWSAETFPKALKRYEFLQYFKEILVSGKEGIKKPDPKIYQLVLERFNIDPQTAIFIDDSARNIAAAEAFGIPSIHFKSPAQLRATLADLGVLRKTKTIKKAPSQPKYKNFLTKDLPQMLRKLTADQAPNFGLMSGQHMVEHLIYTTKSIMKRIGEPEGELTKSQRYFRKFIEKGAPFEHRPKPNLTKADLSPLRSPNIEAAIQGLEAAIQKFYDLFDSNPDFISYNPMMGSFNMAELELFNYQHGRWHAYQFGLIEQFDKVG